MTKPQQDHDLDFCEICYHKNRSHKSNGVYEVAGKCRVKGCKCKNNIPCICGEYR